MKSNQQIKSVSAIDWSSVEAMVEKLKSGSMEIRHLPAGSKRGVVYGRNSKGKDESVMDQFHKIPSWEREMSEHFGESVVVTHVYWDRTGAWNDPKMKPPVRPGYNSLFTSVENMEFDYVGFWEMSRLSRSLVQPLTFIDECDRNGIKIWSEAESRITIENFAAYIMQAVKIGSNNDASSATSKRITSKRNPLNESGFYVGGNLPAGYVIRGITTLPDGSIHKPTFPRTNLDGMVVQGRIVDPLPEFKVALRQVYDLIVNKNGSLNQAAKLFQEAGFINYSESGTKQYGRARYILTNPILVGYLTHNATKSSDGASRSNRYRNYKERLSNVQKDHLGNPVQGVEPILTMNEYLKLQDAINKRSFKRNVLDIALLSGIIKCGRCGGTCSRSTSTSSKTGKQYSCNNIALKKCKGVSIVNNAIEDYVVSEFFARFDSEAIARNRHNYEMQIENAESSMSPDEVRIAQINSEMAKIMDSMLITESESFRATLNAKADMLGKELDIISQRAPQSVSVGNLAMVIGDKFMDISLELVWPELDARQKNALLSEAIEQVLIDSVGKGKYSRDADGNHRFNPERVRIWWKGESKPAIRTI